jgi:hypothetical protein
MLLSDLTIQCALQLASGVSWSGGSAFVLNKYKDDLEALETIVNTVVLPTGVLVYKIIFGSIILVIRAFKLDALEELWKR